MSKTCTVRRLGIFALAVLAFAGAAAPGCSSCDSDAGASLPQATTVRACPDKLAGSSEHPFQGAPGAAAGEQEGLKTSGCVPKGVPTGPTGAGSGFFDDCAKPEVLCVGPDREVKTLTAAATRVAGDRKIARIQVASGLYRESVLFSGIDREIVLQGESNDPSTGVRVVAPAGTTGASETHAALGFTKVRGVTVQRMSLSGEGNGLFIEGAAQVTLSELHLAANKLTGALLRGNAQVKVSSCRILGNGATPAGAAGKPLTGLRFGLAIEGKGSALVSANEIARNGAGGVRVSSGLASAAPGSNNRVSSGDEISVSIDNDDEVSILGNHIHRNGPIGHLVSTGTDAPCDDSCGAGNFCERGHCHPDLAIPAAADRPYGPLALVGVGAAVAGYGRIKVSGNGLFSNDAVALLVHSAGTVELNRNAVERSGVRPKANGRTMETFSIPAVQIWGVGSSLQVQENLIIDNVATGVLISRAGAGAAGTQLAVLSRANHFGGNGRFLLGANLPRGNGLLIRSRADGSGVSVDARDNFFSRNGRAGLATSGAIAGQVSNNHFESHPFRALVMHDTGNSTSGQMTLRSNTIQRAHGYGIQVHGGSVRLAIESNRIADLQDLPSQSGTALREADAVNLTGLKGPTVLVKGNIVSGSKRAGVFVDSSRAEVGDNSIKGTRYPVVSQNGASVTGNDSDLAHKPSAPLKSRKEPQ